MNDAKTQIPLAPVRSRPQDRLPRLSPLSPLSPVSLLTLVSLLVLGVIGLSAVPGHAQLPEEAQQQAQYIELMARYFQFSSEYVEMVSSSETVFHMAIESIVETYQARGEASKAIDHLRRILEDTDDLVRRNLLRLKIRDLLNEFGRTEEALRELDALVKENQD